ncbi:hypothetical protein [Streptomyces rimosus]|uniref:hypothetical protein n=1 Tax=Streptomyces rimosus TaxID=1927 RepID=UPI0004C5E27E
MSVRPDIMHHFEYAHLPADMQLPHLMFNLVAEWMVEALPDGPERSAALRKLLESQDCAVRAYFISE